MRIENDPARPTRAEVEARVRIEFPHGDFAEVLEILDRYGTMPHEKEVDRVHLALLKLSHGVMSELEDLVGMAKTDYRDILACGEYPAQMALGWRKADGSNSEALDRAKKSDLKQYSDWRNITPR
jgi:hypothetical protein